MARTTMVHVKLPAKLKKDAQRLAKKIGLPLSTVVSRKLQEFVDDGGLAFYENGIGPKTTKEILEMSEKIKKGDLSDFSEPMDLEEAKSYLKKII